MQVGGRRLLEANAQGDPDLQKKELKDHTVVTILTLRKNA
jgi:hypothetical protein